MVFCRAESTSSRQQRCASSSKRLALEIVGTLCLLACETTFVKPVAATSIEDSVVQRSGLPYGRLTPLREKPQAWFSPTVEDGVLTVRDSWQEGPVSRFTHANWSMPDHFAPPAPLAVAPQPTTPRALPGGDPSQMHKPIVRRRPPATPAVAKLSLRKPPMSTWTKAPWIELPSVLKPSERP